MTGLSEDELARRAGTTLERIREMAAARLIQPVDGSFDTSDIQLVRVADAFDRTGLPLTQLSELIEAGNYSTSWAPKLFPDPVPSSGKTLPVLAAEVGISEDQAARIMTEAWRLPVPAQGEEHRADDAEMLRLGALAVHAMGPEAISGSRYFGENIRRLTEAQYSFFRRHVEEPIFDRAATVKEAVDTVVDLVVPLLDVGYRLADLLYRRHLETRTVEDIVLNIELAMQEAGVVRERVARPSTIAFFDLTASTQLTESQGDEAAIRLAAALIDLSHEAERHGGRVVKFLGDGGMLHFEDPAAAIRAGLDMVDRAPELGLPASRLGAHVGPVIPRDGDYFGRTVIVAARVTDMTGPSQVTVTEELVTSLEGADDLLFEDGGAAELKGIRDPVRVFHARRA